MTVTGTPCMPAALSWLETSGVRDGDPVSPQGDMGLEGWLCLWGGKRGQEPRKILDNREKIRHQHWSRVREGCRGVKTDGDSCPCPFQWRISGSTSMGRSFGGRAALTHKPEPPWA